MSVVKIRNAANDDWITLGAPTDMTATLALYPTRTELTATLADYATNATLALYPTRTELTATLADYATNATLALYPTRTELTATLADYATNATLGNYYLLDGSRTITGNVIAQGNASIDGTVTVGSPITVNLTDGNMGLTLNDVSATSKLNHLAWIDFDWNATNMGWIGFGSSGTNAIYVANANASGDIHLRTKSTNVVTVGSDLYTYVASGLIVNAPGGGDTVHTLGGDSYQITDSANPFIEAQDTTNTVRTMMRSLNASGWVGTYTAHNFDIRVENLARLTFTTTAGITANNDFKCASDLVVNGNASIDGTVTTATVTTGDTSLGDHGIVLDAIPDGDGEWCGMYCTMTATDNSATVGAPLYCDSNGELQRTSANATSTMPCRFLSLETGTGSIKVLLKGFLKSSSYSWTVGDIVYVATPAGTLTQTVPADTGDIVQTVGIAISASVLYFDPNDVLIERS